MTNQFCCGWSCPGLMAAPSTGIWHNALVAVNRWEGASWSDPRPTSFVTWNRQFLHVIAAVLAPVLVHKAGECSVKMRKTKCCFPTKFVSFTTTLQLFTWRTTGQLEVVGGDQISDQVRYPGPAYPAPRGDHTHQPFYSVFPCSVFSILHKSYGLTLIWNRMSPLS